MGRQREKEPWYAAGLRFRCTACGQCCTGEPGHVWVNEDEISRMARALGMGRRAFEEHHVRRIGGRLSLREQSNGDCAMLKDGRCQVYAHKPQPCSTFPFWSGALKTPEAWDETARRCEGIGQGDLYSAQDVERISAGDASILLERHRHPPEQPVVTAFQDGQRVPSTPPEHEEAAPEHAAPEHAAPEHAAPAAADWEGAFAALDALYLELEHELPRWGFTCSASGACCDFDAYGHRLYATSLEAARFFARTPKRANENARHCPAWGADRLCKSREGRMLGCRVYFCPPYPNGVPEDLYARYFERLRALHEQFSIPYAYRDILDWAQEERAAGVAPGA